MKMPKEHEEAFREATREPLDQVNIRLPRSLRIKLERYLASIDKDRKQWFIEIVSDIKVD